MLSIHQNTVHYVTKESRQDDLICHQVVQNKARLRVLKETTGEPASEPPKGGRGRSANIAPRCLYFRQFVCPRICIHPIKKL